MGSWDRVLDSILSGVQDANINFKDLTKLLEMLGFNLRKRETIIFLYDRMWWKSSMCSRKEARQSHIK